MKAKFELTPDLVRIEKEIDSSLDMLQEESLSHIVEKKNQDLREQLNLKISSKIKKDFKLWCIKNAINMTDALETAIKELIKK